jgi:hypothetical protein
LVRISPNGMEPSAYPANTTSHGVTEYVMKG